MLSAENLRAGYHRAVSWCNPPQRGCAENEDLKTKPGPGLFPVTPDAKRRLSPFQASREQVENFVTHLADWAEKDRDASALQETSPPARDQKATPA